VAILLNLVRPLSEPTPQSLTYTHLHTAAWSDIDEYPRNRDTSSNADIGRL